MIRERCSSEAVKVNSSGGIHLALGEGVPLPVTAPADIKSEGRIDRSEMNKDREETMSTALQGDKAILQALVSIHNKKLKNTRNGYYNVRRTQQQM